MSGFFRIGSKVSNFLNEHNLFIKESAHYGDPETQKFFMRVKVISPEKNIDKIKFNERFKELAGEISMDWSFEDAILNSKNLYICFEIQSLLTRSFISSER